MISIIIPMYNSQKTIIQTLTGLQNQSKDDFEIIIVDDGSTDNSLSIINEFIKKSKQKIIVIKEKNSGPAMARNLGVDNSSGEIIIFLDSDCIPPENWVEEMVKPLKGKIVGCNCGYVVKNKECLVARYVDYEIAKRHERLKVTSIDTIGTYSASFVKKVFLEVGGFDTKYRNASGEDFDFSFKVKRLGYDFIFTNKTFVYHYHPETLVKYLKQQFSRGYWRVRLYSEHKDKIIKGDSYTGYEAQLQFILSIIAMISIVLIFINPIFPIVGFGILILSNLSIGLWSLKKEIRFLLIAPIIASLRSLAGTLGVFKYFINRVI
jgi:glycosyltransferase involved in cell wall biosynthesis